MEYVKYLNLGCNVGMVLINVTTIFFTLHLIYCSKFAKIFTNLDRISNSFFTFLIGRGLGAIIATPYYVYLTAYWSAEAGKKYEPYAHLWLGLGMLIFAFLSSLSALLLTLDRCLALTFPMQYNSRIAKWFLWLTLACYILYSLFVTFHVLREIPLDVEKVHNCESVTCVLLKYRLLIPLYTKFGVGGLNALGSCYLILAIKWNNSDKLKNDVVKFTVIMDIFLDVIPIFTNSIFLTITGIPPAVYIGQLVGTLLFLNVAICSVYYSWRLTRKPNGFWIKICRVEQVSPANTTT